MAFCINSMDILYNLKTFIFGKSPLIRLMIEEHSEIKHLIFKFKEGLGEKTSLEDFHNLQKKLDSHMYSEEKAIFSLHKKKKTNSVVTLLLKQHTSILDLADAVESKIKYKRDFKEELIELEKIHKEHLELEENEFYYKMDKILSNQEKREMVQSYNKYLLGNIPQ